MPDDHKTQNNEMSETTTGVVIPLGDGRYAIGNRQPSEPDGKMELQFIELKRSYTIGKSVIDEDEKGAPAVRITFPVSKGGLDAVRTVVGILSLIGSQIYNQIDRENDAVSPAMRCVFCGGGGNMIGGHLVLCAMCAGVITERVMQMTIQSIEDVNTERVMQMAIQKIDDGKEVVPDGQVVDASKNTGGKVDDA